jgi:hypothetical protein
LAKGGKIKFKTIKLPPLEGVNSTFIPLNKANSVVFFLYIAGFTGKINLPYIRKESQVLKEYFLKMSISFFPLLPVF